MLYYTNYISYVRQVPHLELGLPGAVLPNPELVIARLQVQLGEVESMLQLVQEIVNSWERVPVLDANFVEDAVVDTHSSPAVFFWHQHDWGTTGEAACFDSTTLEQHSPLQSLDTCRGSIMERC